MRRAYFPKRPLPPPPPVCAEHYGQLVLGAWERWTAVINRHGGQLPPTGTPDSREANTAASLMRNYDVLRRRIIANEANRGRE